jgi:hypothetical protein
MRRWALVDMDDFEGFDAETKQAEQRAAALLTVARTTVAFCGDEPVGSYVSMEKAIDALRATGDWWKQPPTGEE